MGRPKLIERRVSRPVQMPTTLSDKLDMYLWSAAEGRVPYGKFSEFVCQACEEKFARLMQLAKSSQQDTADKEPAK